MDVMSLFLLQPDDQIREQCKIMDPRTLARFTQTNKRIRDLCGDILAAHKENYNKQKKELLRFFTEQPGKTFLFEKEGDFNHQFSITNSMCFPDSISMMFVPRDEVFADFLSKIPNVKSGGYYYNVSKDLLSDEIKLDILKMAKKLGYTNVRLYHGWGYTVFKSLNEFYII